MENGNRLSPSLYEKLTGHFSDGILLDRCDEKTQLLLSIRDSICVILNSRQGVRNHLPDYGLPDLSMIYRHLPISARALKKHICQTLLCYEPRLQTIAVEQTLEEQCDVVLSYHLRCYLRCGEHLQFNSHFLLEGQVQLVDFT